MANDRTQVDADHDVTAAASKPRRTRAARVARALPTLLALLVLAAISGSCGKGFFSSANTSPTPTPTTTPTAGALTYVTNFNDAEISEFNRNSVTGALTTPKMAKSGSVKGPIQLTVSPSQQGLYVANRADNKIHQFGIGNSGKLSPIGSGAIAAGTSPQQVAVTPAGAFAYAVNLGGVGSISEYTINAANGALGSNGTVTNGVTHPISVVATDTFFYVADLQSGNGVVLSYAINADGTLATPPSSVPSLGVVTASTPGPMVMDAANGNFVFVSDTVQGIVSVFSTSGGPLSFVSRTLPTNSAQAGIVYVAVGGNTFLYSANQSPLVNSVSVSSFNTVLGVLTLLAASPFGSGLNMPTGLASDPSGQFLYVTNQGNGTVTQFTIDSTTGALSAPASVNTENPANANSAPLFIAITH